jgi:hypothetical protein
MMRDEDDLRAALRTLEQDAPDPGQMLAAIRASDRAAAPPGRPRNWRRAAGTPRNWRRGAGTPRNWSNRIAPLAAAVAVVAVVVSSILVMKEYAPGWAGGDREYRVSTAASPFPTWHGLPGYFAEVSAVLPATKLPGARLGNVPVPPVTRSHVVDIVATSTGKVTATAWLPGYVGALSASAGAFFAASVTGGTARFYEIRLAPGGAHAAAIELPIPPVTPQPGFIAASPDSSRLAISAYGRHGYLQELIVAATATGAERQWWTPAQQADGTMGPMNWLANGTTLAFTWNGPMEVSPSSSLRLLDTAARGDDLLASRAVLRVANPVGSFGGYTISPDGKAMFGIVGGLSRPGVVQGHRVVMGSLIQFAAATRSPQLRYTEPGLPGLASGWPNGVCTDPLWIGKSGHMVLVPCYQHRPGTPTRNAVTMIRVVLLTGHRATPLPWLTAPGYGTVAFPGMPAEGAGIPLFG